MKDFCNPAWNRLSFAILCVFFLSISPALFAQGSASAEEFSGEASVVVFDDFQNNRSEIRYYIIEEESKREKRLFFGSNGNGQAPEWFRTGKKVKARGRGRPDGIDVENLSELDGSGGSADDMSAAEAAIAPPETRKVLTLLVDFNDAVVTGGNYGTTVQAVKDRMYNETKSVANLFFNASLGTLTLDPDGDGDAQQDVFHVTINDSYIGQDPAQCSPSTWVTLASNAFEAATGKDVDIYRHRLLITPNYWDYGNRHCTWGGVAQVGCGSWCWAIGADPQSIMHGVIVHELGHNLGFNHARTDLNNNGYDPDEGTDSGYGDNSDMMGSSRNWKKFNPPHAEDKGWVDPVNYEIREVTPGNSLQSFDLLPLDEEAWDWPGLRTLKLERSSNTDYYVAFRRKSGDYNNLNNEYDNRVLVYYGFDNSTYSYHVATLAAGESFTDPVQDFVLTVTSPVDVVDGSNSTTAMGVEICQQSCSSTPAPSNLTATADSTTSIELNWVDNSDDEDGFEIQRSADGSNWSPLAPTALDVTSYVDAPLNASETWHYRVRATSAIEDSGWSNTANATTQGIPPTSNFSFIEDFLDVDFSDASVANHGAIVAWSWDFGDGGSSAQQNPSYSYASAGTRTVSLTVTDVHGDTDASSQNVTVAEPPPPPVTYHSALGDIPGSGTVSGSFAATVEDGGSVQSIRERESGGKKNNRYSYLQHRWNFSIPAGTSAKVHVNAWQSNSTDGDSFDFSWSSDGNSWNHMFNISDTNDGVTKSHDLPADTEGTVYIQVLDTDQTSGNRSQDTVYVDFLQIEVSNLPPLPLEGTRPTGLIATASGHDTIELSWVDNTANESGFSIERSTNNFDFAEVGTSGAGMTTYTDTGLNQNTPYYYQVSAYKGEEYTPPSDVDSATTTAAPAITLSLVPFKVRGKHSVDLSWDGAGGANVDVFRSGSNGAWQTSTPNDGELTHTTSYKGGATYTFKVCETGSTTACSSEETVVF